VASKELWCGLRVRVVDATTLIAQDINQTRARIGFAPPTLGTSASRRVGAARSAPPTIFIQTAALPVVVEFLRQPAPSAYYPSSDSSYHQRAARMSEFDA